MNVQIQSLKFDADAKLIAFIETKLSKLDRFSDEITSADVFLKLDHDITEGNKVATIVLDVTGAQLVAEKRSRSFEESVEACFDALKIQIAKHKER